MTTERSLYGRKQIGIFTLLGIEACVKAVCNPIYTLYGDILRQHSVKFVGYVVAVNLLYGVEVGYVERGIYARIGTPSTHYLGRTTQ